MALIQKTNTIATYDFSMHGTNKLITIKAFITGFCVFYSRTNGTSASLWTLVFLII